MNPLRRLTDLGQSVYLDEISRPLIEGELKGLIDNDGLHGVTSNPVIFEKAIAQSRDYDDLIAELAALGKSAAGAYEAIAVRDIQDAADLFRRAYEESKAINGYVSLEVSPELAHDTEGTVQEARRLWRMVDRPNVFIKVPGTAAGLPAIRELISEGININVTLLFSLKRYEEVAESYFAGVKSRLTQGHDVSRIASVASFFLSRIDAMVDPLLDHAAENEPSRAEIARSLRGEVAISSAKQAYQIYKSLHQSHTFEELRARGARPQRLLWASTGTKDPAYSEVKYVEPLVGVETINTMPKATLEAYRQRGQPELRLEQGIDDARRVIARLAEVGIDLDEITGRLEAEGVKKFVEPFRSLLKTLETALSRAPA